MITASSGLVQWPAGTSMTAQGWEIARGWVERHESLVRRRMLRTGRRVLALYMEGVWCVWVTHSTATALVACYWGPGARRRARRRARRQIRGYHHLPRWGSGQRRFHGLPRRTRDDA